MAHAWSARVRVSLRGAPVDELTPPPPPGQDPLALASIGCAVGGTAVYCCGSFLGLGWLAFPVWLVGLVLGIVSTARSEGTSRILAIVGIGLNVLPAVAFGVMIVLGTGISLRSNLSQH